MQYDATCGARPSSKEQAGSVSCGAGSLAAVGWLDRAPVGCGVVDAKGSAGGAIEHA